MLFLGIAVVAICFAVACSRTAHATLIIEVPTGYSGPVDVELGVTGAPALQKEGDEYIVPVPATGHVSTSTILLDTTPEFKNVGHDRVWGYESSILKAGDGIPVGGNIDFFIGTKEQYQIELTKRHKSSIIDLQDRTPASSMSTATLASF
jgi:hypothetical protein